MAVQFRLHAVVSVSHKHLFVKQTTVLTSVPACLLQQCSEAIRRELFQERTAVLKAQADEAAAAQKALQEKEFRWVLADRVCLT